MEPPQERVVQSASIVRGEDRRASETLDSLQKIVDLDAGVTVVATLTSVRLWQILDIAPLHFIGSHSGHLPLGCRVSVYGDGHPG